VTASPADGLRGPAPEVVPMTIGVAQLGPVLSIVFGVLILLVPRLLNYFVGVYLILAGLLALGVGR
jgi:uncharacterized membrane protein